MHYQKYILENKFEYNKKKIKQNINQLTINEYKNRYRRDLC